METHFFSSLFYFYLSHEPQQYLQPWHQRLVSIRGSPAKSRTALTSLIISNSAFFIPPLPLSLRWQEGMAERPSDVLNNQNEEVSEVEEVRLQPILRYKVFQGGGGWASFVHLPCRDQTQALLFLLLFLLPNTHTLRANLSQFSELGCFSPANWRGD